MLYQVRLSGSDHNLDLFIQKVRFYDYIIVRHKSDNLIHVHYHIVGNCDYAQQTVRKSINDFGLKGNKQYNLSIADEKGYQYILKEGSIFIKSDSFKINQIEHFRQLSIDYVKELKLKTVIKNKEKVPLKKVIFDAYELATNKPSSEDEFIMFVIEIIKDNKRVVCKTQLKSQILTLMLNVRDDFKYNLAQQIKEDFAKGWY